MKGSYAVEALAALAQGTRLNIFRLMVQRGPRGLAAGEIAARMRLPSPTLSFHLAQLKHAGLVKSRREGWSIIYLANYRAMEAFIAYLTENCCQGRPELCAAAASSETKGRQAQG
jgi:ArsR family transcriptional regulator